MTDYDHKAIEAKWQEQWADDNVFNTSNDDNSFYCLEMFPYPSGSMHMGHVRNYAIGDCISRYQRMQGKTVLHPMGWDAFGLPAENAAIQRGISPAEWTKDNIETLKSQMQMLGFDYDWDREIKTCDPDYYKWDQWLFLKLYEEGLAYQDSSKVNWCPGCQTVLANEQVENGECWRCDTDVVQKTMQQWNLAIQEYADEHVDDLDLHDDWPDKVKKMQRDWIGRSHGATIEFPVDNAEGSLTVFTTRPDTIHGATFMAVAPEHELAQRVAKTQGNVRAYIDDATKRSDEAREQRSKAGIFTGEHAINPVTGDKIPIYVAEFVLADYGTGAIMAVPGHDQRDHEFAKEHNIHIQQVIQPEENDHDVTASAYEGDGTIINSDSLNGLSVDQAQDQITSHLEENNIGEATTRYRLQDWTISRQRYWGTPIPILHCDECGTIPVPEDDLPVELPDDVEFTEQGNPLSTSTSFKTATCPQCGGEARRETDTMDTFVNSSWYFLRFCNPHNDEAIVDTEEANAMMPVDKYIGGVEHAVMHLLYARFITKFLRDQGVVNVDEPFTDLLTQGMVHLDGKQMSKSKQHLVSPEETVDEYGADTGRTFMLFLGKPEKAVDWSEEGIQGIHRFLNRTYRLPSTDHNDTRIPYSKDAFQSKWNRLLQRITNAMEETRLNEAVKHMMSWQQLLSEYDRTRSEWSDSFAAYLRCLVPFAPHLAEELWHDNIDDTYASTEAWPTVDETAIKPTEEYKHTTAETVLDDLEEIKDLAGIPDPARITFVTAAPWKYELAEKIQGLIAKGELDDAVSKIMQTDLRSQGDDAVSLTQTYIENQAKLPSIAVSENDDQEAVQKLETILDATMRIESEDTTTAASADQALPGKPAIILHEE
jgi:leucyl-tRNA synthetase